MNTLIEYTYEELITMYAMGKDVWTDEELKTIEEEIEYRELGCVYDDDDETDRRKDYLENYASDIFEACDVDEVMSIHFGV